MASPADIVDPAFRAALEEADRLLDEGDFSAASKKCAETYLMLLEQRPELIPPAPPAAGGQGLGSFQSYLRGGTPTWPRTGGLNVVFDEDRKPRLTFDKERFSFSEAAGYYEFLMNELWRLQQPAG
jgi:hypothetical protein